VEVLNTLRRQSNLAAALSARRAKTSEIQPCDHRKIYGIEETRITFKKNHRTRGSCGVKIDDHIEFQFPEKKLEVKDQR